MSVDLTRLHTNQRLLVEELLRRGAVVAPFDYDLELLEVTYEGRTEFLMDRTTRATPYLSSSFTADKHLTKQILARAGISTPEGRVFDGAQASEAAAYAASIGFPLVLKPNVGSHGDLVQSGLETTAQVESAIAAFIAQAGPHEYFIIERHIPGHEYRIFVTAKGDYAVLMREPAHVVGDGVRTIADLAAAETERRQAVKQAQGSALCPIALDGVVDDFLKRKGLDIRHIPKKKEKIALRLSSNLAQGGISRDMTDEVHPTALSIARRALAAFEGLPCLGIDFLTPDIAADQTRTPHAIIEVNANPGLAMHHMPAIGAPRNVAAHLADILFPSEKVLV